MNRILVRAPALLIALFIASAALAYDEPASVRARFPDPATSFDTPGFAAGRKDFTTHEEMMSFVEALQQRADNVTVRIAGESQEGRAIPLLRRNIWMRPRGSSSRRGASTDRAPGIAPS